MNKEYSIGMRGRHGKQVFIEGEIMELRSLFNHGSSKAITLPKLWLLFVSGENKVIEGIGILQDGDKLILRPYYGENGNADDKGEK